jgi:hypothetical protein
MEPYGLPKPQSVGREGFGRNFDLTAPPPPDFIDPYSRVFGCIDPRINRTNLRGFAANSGIRSSVAHAANGGGGDPTLSKDARRAAR